MTESNSRKVKLDKRQKRELENLLLQANRQPSAEVANWVEKEGLRNVYRCSLCQATNWLYPHVLHMERQHGVVNYFKTISNLEVA